jgi:RES domain
LAKEDQLPATFYVVSVFSFSEAPRNDGGFETLCQALGRAVRNSGVTGVLYASVRVKGGINLVVFRDPNGKAQRARLLGADELKRYLA